MRPHLIVLAGLPGAGKSTVAEALARQLQAPVLSVDPIEEALHGAGLATDQPLGLAAYLVAYALADRTLELGVSVVVDAVNGSPEARTGWRELGVRHATPVRFIEVVCSDPATHRARVELRGRSGRVRFAGVAEPGWAEVEARRPELAGWDDERLVVDSVEPLDDGVARIRAWLGPSPVRADFER